jgi:hypothetical protein
MKLRLSRLSITELSLLVLVFEHSGHERNEALNELKKRVRFPSEDDDLI